jgi:GNAT superfamily N-acetyltransferase
MNHRRATAADCSLLAVLNHRLIADEGHRSRMTVAELEERMRGWLARDYVAILFEDGGEVAYALYREQPEEIYLRQLYVVRDRRRQGIGRRAVGILRTEIWPRTKRLTVDVLTGNGPAIAFWRAVGYRDYCLTLEIMPPEGNWGDVAARGPQAAAPLRSVPPGPNDSTNP